jgi:hypothetical protein
MLKFYFGPKGGAEIFQGAIPKDTSPFSDFLNFPLFIMYEGMAKTLRIISIRMNAVFTSPYTLAILGFFFN